MLNNEAIKEQIERIPPGLARFEMVISFRKEQLSAPLMATVQAVIAMPSDDGIE